MSDKLAAQIIINILANRMNLDPSNQIWLQDQNRKIPPDNKLYVVVGMVDAKIMCNTSSMITQTIDDVPTEYEVDEVMMCEYTQIDILSRSNQALFRKPEVVASLGSIYSKQQQELNNFKIFRIPQSFVNTSSAEGGSLINRYTIVVPCFIKYTYTTLLGDYYDDFTTRADDDVTIDTDNPIAEFEITPDTPPPP